MDFALSSDQLEIRDLALKFARNEMIPHAQEYDEHGKFPAEISKKPGNLV